VAIPGDSAAKWGVLYEARWTVNAMLRVLNGDATSIRIAPPGEDFAEFELQTESLSEYHQAKRAIAGVGSWSVKTLFRRSVLGPFKEKIDEGSSRCLFVSGQDADELHTLSNGARSAESPQEFMDEFLTSDDLKKAFTDLRDGWKCDEAVAVDLLKKIDIETASENVLLEMAYTRAEKLVDARPQDVIALLSALALDSVNQRLYANDIWRVLEQGGRRRREWNKDPNVASACLRATAEFVERLKARAIGGVVIQRGEAQAIAALFEGGQQVVLGAGEAGAGKSLVVAQVIEMRSAEVAILAFRADGVTPTRRPEAIGADLDLPGSPTTVLAAVADGRPALLVIDQLDAVSTASGRQAEFLEAMEKIVSQARAYPNIQVLLACRRFDLDNDRRLRALVAEGSVAASVPIERLDKATVREALGRAGVDPALYDERQLELLSLPLHLSLLVEVAQEKGHLDFRTETDLFGEFWSYKRGAVERRLGRAPRWTDVIDRLCDHMSEGQVLSAPYEILDDFDEDASAMASENVIVVQGNRVSFFHEGFFDYAFVRRYVGRGGSLETLLSDGEQHLFRRAQVRQFLGYERAQGPSQYLSDLEAVLNG
jgi:hypothetical protein